MVFFRACPRCHGDLHMASDIHGRFVACLQCGHYLTEAEERALFVRRLAPQMERAA